MAKKKKRVSKAPKKTRKFSGKNYRLIACSKKKADANKKAKSLRGKKKKARIVSTLGRHCVYARG